MRYPRRRNDEFRLERRIVENFKQRLPGLDVLVVLNATGHYTPAIGRGHRAFGDHRPRHLDLCLSHGGIGLKFSSQFLIA